MDYLVTVAANASYKTVAELKTHLLLFGDNSYDSELQSILLAAEDYLSGYLGEFISPTTVRVNVSSFGDTKLPHKANAGVVVTYWDAANTAQVVPSGDYVVDTSGAYPVIKYTTTPTGLSALFDYVGYITYTTSLGIVSPKLSSAILLVAAELFENRNNSSEKKAEAVQLSAMRLIQSLRGW